MIRYSLIIFLITFIFSSSFGQIIETDYGYVEGRNNGRVFEFLGIPYASPPVGELRWVDTQIPVDWNDTLLVQQYPPACPQQEYAQGSETSVYTGEEDCLYLNIWTKDIEGKKPVMFFIHGGGNQQGKTNTQYLGTNIYDGTNLADRGDIVLITVQYRLGPLGFLSHPGLDKDGAISGNYGIKDLILALKWVKANIEHFGGDPDNVMIFGESAGAVNVNSLLLSPKAYGLFDKAGIQSGAPVVNSKTIVQQKGIEYAQSVTGTSDLDEQVARLKTKNPQELVEGLTSPLEGGVAQSLWNAVIDNEYFTQTARESFEDNAWNKVAVLVGSNADESSISAPPVVQPNAVKAIIDFTFPPTLRPTAYSLYPIGNTAEEARASYVQLLTDGQFTSNARRMAQCYSTNNPNLVFRYFFSFVHTIPQLKALGSYHGMELFYVFNTWENTSLGSGILFRPQDKAVQDFMLTAWTNFAKTGNPNGSLLPNWPIYDGLNDCYMDINAVPSGQNCGLRTDKCNLWDAAVNYIPCMTSSTQESEKMPEIVIVPNPVIDKLDVWKGSIEVNKYQIIDGKGKILCSGTRFPIDVSILQEGFYLLRLEMQNGNVKIQKFVKH